MRTIGLLSILSLSMVFAILYSAIARSVRLDHHGERAAGTDRVGNGTLDRGTAALRRVDDRLHHPDRHIDTHGILKISHYINLAIQEDMPFGRELVMRGSLERLTPS